MSSFGDPVGIVVPQPTGPALRVIGLSVVRQKDYSILAVPAKSCSYLAEHEGRDDADEPVAFCLICVQSTDTSSDTTGWRRATQFESCPTRQSVLRAFSDCKVPVGVKTDSMESAASHPAANQADHLLELPKKTDSSQAEPRQACPQSTYQCPGRRTDTHSNMMANFMKAMQGDWGDDRQTEDPFLLRTMMGESPPAPETHSASANQTCRPDPDHSNFAQDSYSKATHWCNP